MVIFITMTTLIHGSLFFYDEYILHKRRGLSRKEINNALFDGIFYLVIVGMTIFAPYNEITDKIFLFLGLLSCMSILRNEYFYPEISKLERIVHAGLYILHPLILYAFYLSWQQDFFNNHMTYWMIQLCYMILGFKAISYHVIYWNYIHGK